MTQPNARLLILLLLLGLLAAAHAAPAPAPTAPDVPYRTAKQTLFSLRRPEPVTIQSLCLSPDGTRLVWGIEAMQEDGAPDARCGVFVSELDGNDARHLSDGWAPRWSPHGARVSYFTGGKGKGLELWTVRPDGTGAQRVAEGLVNDAEPFWEPYEWSPDGEHLAWVARDAGRHGPSLYVASPSGAGRREMLAAPEGVIFQWAPEGKRLCAWHVLYGPPTGDERPRRDPRSRAFVIEMATGLVTEVPEPRPGSAPGCCAFSPDGRRFAFVSYGPEKSEAPDPIQSGRKVSLPRIRLWLADGPEATPRELANCTGWDASVSWSPKGDRLALAVLDDATLDYAGRFALWRATGERICRFQEGCDPVWSPDGKRLAFTGNEEDGPRPLMVCDNAGQRRTEVAWDVASLGLCWARDGAALLLVCGEDVESVARVDLRR